MSIAFAYAATRIKGLKSKLLSETRLRQLLEVKTIPEMIQLLEESDYKEDFVAMSTKYSDMELVMRALHENFKSTLRKLIKISPKDGREALGILLKEYYIQTINAIIASKASGTPLLETELTFADPSSEKLIQKIMAAASVEDVLLRLKGTEYAQKIRKATKEYEATKDFRIITRALNEHYFEMLKTLNTKKYSLLWELIESKNNIKNLMVVLRIKQKAQNADASKFFVMRDKFALELNKINEFPKILEKVSQKYPQIAPSVNESAKTSSLIPVEIALEGLMVKRTLRILRLGVMNFAAILGYLYLKELEISEIRKIAYAKKYDFTEELKAMVYSFNA
ncbi:V-type ATPase subunit [Candidatus Micrarchaeota archaeon]|nr:V-type ATPase subunit [Candidatus Micrarchaeota archaeon]